MEYDTFLGSLESNFLRPVPTIYHRLKIDTLSRMNLEDYLKKEAFDFFIAVQAKHFLLKRNNPVHLKLFYVNPKINKFAIVDLNSLDSILLENAKVDDLDDIMESNVYEILIKDLSCTFIDEIPSKFITFIDLNIEKGSIMELQHIKDISQYMISKKIIENTNGGDIAENQIVIVNVINKNYNFFSETNKYYNFQVLANYFDFTFKTSNIIFTDGDPVIGSELIKFIGCTNGIKIINGSLVFEENPHFHLIMMDSMDGLIYNIKIINQQYELQHIPYPEQYGIQESFNPFVLDEDGKPHRLILNNKLLTYI